MEKIGRLLYFNIDSQQKKVVLDTTVVKFFTCCQALQFVIVFKSRVVVSLVAWEKNATMLNW